MAPTPRSFPGSRSDDGTLIVSWWAWTVGGILLGLASGLFAMVSLSAGTAYGTEFHNMSPAQRIMARVLYLGSLAACVACAVLGLGLIGWSVKLLLA